MTTNLSLLEALRHAHATIENSGMDADFLEPHIEVSMNTQTLSLLERCKEFIKGAYGTISNVDVVTLIDDLEAAIAAERSKEQAKPLNAARMPCGTAVTNVYEAWEAGRNIAQETPLDKPQQENFDKLSALGWQAVECSICGSHAMAYQKPRQEPDAEVVAVTKLEDHSEGLTPRIIALNMNLIVGAKLYTSPQPLKPLSDEGIIKKELDAVWQAIEDADDGEQPAYRHCQEIVRERARAIEAKLGAQHG